MHLLTAQLADRMWYCEPEVGFFTKIFRVDCHPGVNMSERRQRECVCVFRNEPSRTQVRGFISFQSLRFWSDLIPTKTFTVHAFGEGKKSWFKSFPTSGFKYTNTIPEELQPGAASFVSSHTSCYYSPTCRRHPETEQEIHSLFFLRVNSPPFIPVWESECIKSEIRKILPSSRAQSK